MTSGDGSELLKVADNITDLIHKLAGPLADELGHMLGDSVRVYRVKNSIKTAQKTQVLLRDAGLPVNVVPPRLLLPILEGCSIEDNETLQELWAGLLATASQQGDALSPSFIETLKQLTPDEARYLDKLFKAREGLRADRRISSYAFATRNGAPRGSGETFERLGLVRKDYVADLKTSTRNPGNDITIEEASDVFSDSDVEVGYWRAWTDYAIKFWKACHGPRKAPAP